MEVLKNNWQWKLVSLVLGFFLWSYVTAGVNPTQQVTLRDIPIELVNQEDLIRDDYLITLTEPSSISVMVEGKRNALGDISSEDVSAVIDVSNFEEGTSSYDVDFRLPQGVSMIDPSTRQVNLTIEKIITRSVDVQIVDEGQLADNLILESVIANPQSVEIQGPRSKVESVEYLLASVDVSGMTEDSSTNVRITPVDSEGSEVEGLTMGLSSVNVAISILQQKELPIVADLRGDLSDDISLERVHIVPNTIWVKGKTSLIEELEEIRTEPIDQTAIEDDINREVDLVFPDGIEPVADMRTTELTIDVEKKVEKTLIIPYSSIEILNPEELDVELENPDDNLTVVVSGFPEDLENFEAENVNVRADLSKAEEEDNGNLLVPVEFQVTDRISLVSSNPREIIFLSLEEVSSEE